jgi:DNA-binding MarR family transcriptional regulator
MARDGWIERRQNGTDRRCKTVHLSRKAKDVMSDINQEAAALRGEIFQELPQTDLNCCIQVLEHIKERL